MAACMTKPALMLFNSLTRALEPFTPLDPGKASVYTCGPTVYDYQHIGNMRAYIFADTLGRALTAAGYDLTHVVNITDVGHLTSDADAGDDKMEAAAAEAGKSAWDIARYYQQVFEDDLARLNVRPVHHPKATDHVEAMIAWGEQIADRHCYLLDSGLYFDVTTVPDYGKLARAHTDEGEGRIDSVEGKRNAADFAIWRLTPEGETRQMEWDSPWGRGAPGWHIECSVMSAELLGHPFDIHTGGIDHREIHHPNEIAQNQAHGCTADTGARLWMHNNFLVDRRGKMSKSSGEFLTLQALVDRGYHPLAYRMMCLQAHYRSELEFTWEGLHAALVRLKRIVIAVERLRGVADGKEPEDVHNIIPDQAAAEMFNDLNTPIALKHLDAMLVSKEHPVTRLEAVEKFDQMLGLDLVSLTREDLRIHPKDVQTTEEEIQRALARRTDARAAKDFATSDAIRDELAAQGVEVMDGDPLGWEWKLS